METHVGGSLGRDGSMVSVPRLTLMPAVQSDGNFDNQSC